MYNDIDFYKFFDNDSKYGKEYNKGKLNDNTIKETEKLLGRKLPKSYIEFLTIQNGGYISDNFGDCWLTAIDGLESSQSNIYLEDSYDPSIKDEVSALGLAKSLVPFGETQSGGHDVYCMDFSSVDENGEPRIVRVELEGKVELYFVANNFEKFINKIVKMEDINGTFISDEKKVAQELHQKSLDDIDGNISVCKGITFIDIIILIIGIFKQNVPIIVICVLVILLTIPFWIKFEKKYKSEKEKNK